MHTCVITLCSVHTRQGYTTCRTHAHVTNFMRERQLSFLSMTSGCIYLLPKLTIGKGLSSYGSDKKLADKQTGRQREGTDTNFAKRGGGYKILL